MSGCAAQTPIDESPNDVSSAVTSPSLRLMKGTSGAMLAQTCFGCHGPEGRSGGPATPSLAGLPENYFIKVMEAYQFGGRYASVMGRIALGFDRQEIVRMAKYFNQLDTPFKFQRVDWSKVSEGRRLHRRYCMRCHGDLRQAPEAKANRLNGEWMAYLRWTLQDFLIGINQADAEMAKEMTMLIRRHGDESLEALVHYYASARP